MLLASLLCVALAPCARAVETAPGAVLPDEFDPRPLIGMDLAAALDAFGTPREIFALRGPSEADDDVVFFYDQCLYLFWFRNRVWQVRFDRRFDRRVLGLAIGMSRVQAEAACAAPLAGQDGSLYFDLADCPCPVRVRLLFDEEGLADIYVYRSDW
jgi:hypothetical protein